MPDVTFLAGPPRRWITGLAAAVSVSMLVASCTTEEQSSPRPTLTSTTSTTTTDAPVTTEAPIDSTTSTSAAPESTTTEAPTGPVDALVPLFVGGADSAGWLFLGAWQQDRWQESSDASGEPIRPGVAAGTGFVVSNLDGETPAVLGENIEACFDGRVGPAIDVDVAAPDPPGFGYNAVAVLQPSWALQPRPVAVTSTAPEAYRALGVAAFDDEPVDGTQGAVEQLVVADLDGDGDDEALASFEFIQPSAGPGAPGDLAALLVIDATTRVAQTVLLSAVPDEDVDDDLGSFEIIERFRVLDVADLNGDGRMEVLVHAWYYEGAAVIVFTYDDDELTEVLSAGCGA